MPKPANWLPAAIKVYPKEKVTFLDAETRQLVTRPQGLAAGIAATKKLLPNMAEAEVERILTYGGLISNLDFETARRIQFKLDTCEAQYVKSVIQLTIPTSEAFAAITRPAKGETVCNNDWGKNFISNPFKVVRRIFEAPDEVKAEPFASPHAWWKVRRGGEGITLWRYNSGTTEVNYDLEDEQGMTYARYDHELFFLVRTATEALTQ